MSKGYDLRKKYADKVRRQQALIHKFESLNAERLLVGLETLSWEQFVAERSLSDE